MLFLSFLSFKNSTYIERIIFIVAYFCEKGNSFIISAALFDSIA